MKELDWWPWCRLGFNNTGPEVIKLFPCSSKLSTKSILLINVEMPIIAGILTDISMINTTSERLKAALSVTFDLLILELMFLFFKNRVK